MSDPIRITPEDLADPHIDTILSSQQSFGLPSEEGRQRQPLWYRPWFALMLAGLIGALAAWALVEPHFQDGIRFQTRILEVRTLDQALPRGLSNQVLDIRGATVLLPTQVRVRTPDGKPATLEDLKPGLGLDLATSPGQADGLGSRTAVAWDIRILKEPPATDRVDFAALQSRNAAPGLLLFMVTAGLVGLCIGATDGALSRAWRRAFRSALVGLLVGCAGGLVALIPAGLVFSLGSSLAQQASDGTSLQLSGFPLFIHIMGRGLAWSVAGMAAGLGQGVALKSRRLLLNGLLGGAVGALLGGVLFDPLDLLVHHLTHTVVAWPSRMVGLALVGAGAGLMMGLVELLVRESWVRVLTGPIAGKEFMLYRDPTWIGSSPKCEIFLFKDPLVAPRHAAIHRSGEHYELRDGGASSGTQVEGRPVSVIRLQNRSRIAIGKTILEFRVKDV